MKERPIIFGSPMIRAILDGKKTQTRRIVRPQPNTDHEDEPYWHVGGYRAWRYRSTDNILRKGGNLLTCPYGEVGDRLWVRETWCAESRSTIYYRADGWEYGRSGGWKTSIFMPRWASRITLEITGVRVERLHDISEEDARAEGAPVADILTGRALLDQSSNQGCHKWGFELLWDSINAKRSPWASNPWVWVISFKKLET